MERSRGATEYVVYQAESSGTTTEDYTEVATTTNTNATVTGLENGEQYYFRVAGRNNVGEGPLSTEVDATADLPPTEITAMGGTTVRELTLTLDPQDNSTDGGSTSIGRQMAHSAPRSPRGSRQAPRRTRTRA